MTDIYSKVIKFFSPPVFPEDAEKTRQAYVLNVLLLCIGGIMMLVGLPGYFLVMTVLSVIGMVIVEASDITLPRIFLYPPGTILILFILNLRFTVPPMVLTINYLSATIQRARADLEEKKSAEKAAAQRAAEMEMLYRVGMEFSKSRDLQSLLERIYNNVSAIFPINTFYIAIYDEQTKRISFPLFKNNGKTIPIEPRNLDDKSGLTGHIIKNRSLLYLPDINAPEAQKEYDIIIMAPSVTRSFLGIPLLSEGHIIGVMSVQASQPHAYNAEQIRMFEMLSIQAANGIERALLVDQLQNELTEREKAQTSLQQERDLLRERQIMTEKVLEMGKLIAQETDLDACLRLAHQCIQKGLDVDRVGLFLYNTEEEILQGTYGTDREGNIYNNTGYKDIVLPESA